jgi:hypothetical protein
VGSLHRVSLFFVATVILWAFPGSSIAPVPPEIIPPSSPAFASSNNSITTDLSDYVWPTDAGNIGTSTFGEYRRTHFHGGIDISTGNSTGYRVFAVRDGYVARIRVSPVGYGNMLYIKHADGYYSTYAHLSHFNALIDVRVLREQMKGEAFTVDFELPPNEIPVSKGEVVAYTGDTGVGTAHLHFEIRDENLEPINPLLCTKFSFPDRIAPVIKRLAITPIGPMSSVSGSASPHILTPRSVKTGQSRITETLQLTGEAGFAVSAYDMSNGSRFRHGLYSHKLFIDDSLIYRVQIDRVPGKNAHEIGLYYDWNLQSAGRGRFERLYAETPSGLLFYSPRIPKAGIINVAHFSEGVHTYKIVSTDFNQNSTEVSGKILMRHSPAFEITRAGNDLRILFPMIGDISRVLMSTQKNGGGWTLKTMTPSGFAEGNVITVSDAAQRFDVVKVIAEDVIGSSSLPQFLFLRKPSGTTGTLHLDHELHSDFVKLRVKASHAITEQPDAVVYEGTEKRTVPLTAIAIDEYVGSFRPSEKFSGMRRVVVNAEVNGHMRSAINEFDLYPIVAGASGVISYDSENLILRYDSTSVYKTIFMRIQKVPGDAPHYSLIPENAVLAGQIRVTIRHPHPDSRQGLFFSGLGGWELLDRTTSPDQQMFTGTVTRTFGDVAIMSDGYPPSIARLSIGRSGSGRVNFSFRYGDNFSGVEYKELKTYIDGVAVIPQVDGEHRRVTYSATHPLERGTHHLTIRIMDKMGNSSTVERQFSVR